MIPRHVHIVGHGLAGAILAETASRAGIRVSVEDDGGPASSRVAAGLYTPLTGRRILPSWELDQAYPVLQTFYPELETTLQQHFFHPLPTLRILRDAKQQKEVAQHPEHPFIQNRSLPSDLPFHSPWGGFEMQGGGWVDLPVLLDALQARRIAKGEWGTSDTPPDLTVWAQGARAANDPRWKDVGWRNAHGDILTVELPGLSTGAIYNFGRFLLPIGDSRFRCGATYFWHATSPVPRPEARQELEDELTTWLKIPFTVVDHQAGIRPVALARVPVVGPHPDHPDHWIFNGFASKGVLYAPWMAQRLVRHWLNGEPLPREVEASRRILRQRAREQTREGQARHSGPSA
jgi:glycine/D-amino acid oxidase-like deaminating enzyme